MKSNLFARCFFAILVTAGFVWALNSSSSAQSRPKPLPPSSSQNGGRLEKDSEKEKPNRPLASNNPLTADENAAIEVDTPLVTIPVSVMDRDGKFIPYLIKQDFRLYEDGVEQDIEGFNSFETPFHVVLALDTSNSTTFRFKDIQDAAFAFIRQLRPDDQVMVVSFESKVRIHCDFTSDYGALRRAIDETRIGRKTKLYEAVDNVVDRLGRIEGRKAIVLLTDGVDTASHGANFQNTILKVEESGALVYPIKFDTENARRIIDGRGPYTNSLPWPTTTPPDRRRSPFSQSETQLAPGRQSPQRTGRAPSSGRMSGPYRRAARYLKELADRSGGQLYDADSLYNIAGAFSNIAEELRHQYALSYYPTNPKKDGSYRIVKVGVDKPGMIVRTRVGYRAGAKTQAKSDASGTVPN
ncbi:MAG: VWA domain-containing protein [Chloracidobacterium sp.]|nr:VWA domain-containing protein [Chloracidobacterium sp.]